MPRPHEENKNYLDITMAAGEKTNAIAKQQAAVDALRNMADIAALLDEMTKEVDLFRKQREAIGEYDGSSAPAIIVLAGAVDKLTRYLLVLSKAMLAMEMDR